MKGTVHYKKTGLILRIDYCHFNLAIWALIEITLYLVIVNRYPHLDHLVNGSLGYHLDPHPECQRHGETVEPDLSPESDPSKSHF